MFLPARRKRQMSRRPFSGEPAVCRFPEALRECLRTKEKIIEAPGGRVRCLRDLSISLILLYMFVKFAINLGRFRTSLLSL